MFQNPFDVTGGAEGIDQEELIDFGLDEDDFVPGGSCFLLYNRQID